MLSRRRPGERAGVGDLGSEQADADRASGQAAAGLSRRSDVAQDGDLAPVGRQGGPAGPVLWLAITVPGRGGAEFLRARVDDQLTGIGVQHAKLPGGRGQHDRVDPGDHRHAQAAGDDRGMRAGAAGHRCRSHQPGLGELDQLGRADLAPDQDEVAGWRRRGASFVEKVEDRLADLADVIRPLGQLEHR